MAARDAHRCIGTPGGPCRPLPLGGSADRIGEVLQLSAALVRLSALESRLAGLRQFFSTLPSNADFTRAGSGIQQQIEAYQALSAELDRLDPAGAARRRAQEVGVMETLRRGLEAQRKEMKAQK